MNKKIEITDLITGFRFPPVSYTVATEALSTYLNAVEDKSETFKDSNFVPPMTLAALAMAAMGKQMELPAGSIHVSQQYSFNGLARNGEQVTSYASVKRNIERSKLHMLTIELNIENERKEIIVSGETGFILPRF